MGSESKKRKQFAGKPIHDVAGGAPIHDVILLLNSLWDGTTSKCATKCVKEDKNMSHGTMSVILIWQITFPRSELSSSSDIYDTEIREVQFILSKIILTFDLTVQEILDRNKDLTNKKFQSLGKRIL